MGSSHGASPPDSAPVVPEPVPEPEPVVPEPEPEVPEPEPEVPEEDEVDDDDEEDVPVARSSALIEEALNATLKQEELD
jgi:hypothetical protein